MSAASPLIGRYCGTKIPPEIQSSSGLLSLSFHTDMAVAKDGFSVRYNMTHREVTDCECKITFRKCVCVCKLSSHRFVFLLLFPSLFSSLSTILSVISADAYLSFFIYLSSHPLDLFSFAYFYAISVSMLFLTPLSLFYSLLREHDSQKQTQTIFF